MMEDQCHAKLNKSETKMCNSFRCKLDNFCEFNGRPPASEYERDFLFVLGGRSRSKTECEAVKALDFINAVSTTDLGDFALHVNNTHLKYAENHLWCNWEPVLGRCVHSGRFCYMLQSEYLCNNYCPAFKWHNIDVVANYSSKFTHLFSDPGQVAADLRASSIPGVCNGTGDPFVKVEHINHECIAGPAGGWKDFPPWLSGRPSGADLNTREPAGSFLGSVIWITLILYGFIGIAIVCDEYFEPSLRIISKKT